VCPADRSGGRIGRETVAPVTSTLTRPSAAGCCRACGTVGGRGRRKMPVSPVGGSGRVLRGCRTPALRQWPARYTDSRGRERQIVPNIVTAHSDWMIRGDDGWCQEARALSTAPRWQRSSSERSAKTSAAPVSHTVRWTESESWSRDSADAAVSRATVRLFRNGPRANHRGSWRD